MSTFKRNNNEHVPDFLAKISNSTFQINLIYANAGLIQASLENEQTLDRCTKRKEVFAQIDAMRQSKIKQLTKYVESKNLRRNNGILFILLYFRRKGNIDPCKIVKTLKLSNLCLAQK